MKKVSAIAAMIALSFAAVASAGTIDLSFCIADQGGNGPACGDFGCGGNVNPTLYLAPSDQNATLATTYAFPGLAYDEGALGLKMDVTQRGDGCGFETVSSLGLDVDAVLTQGVTLPTADDLNIFNTAAETGAANDPWSGTNTTGSGGLAPNLITDARAVAVPGSTGDPLWNGYCPGNDYNVAELPLTAGDSGGPGIDPQSCCEVRMIVGPLKITRVYEPSSTQGGAPEDVSFGFDAAGVGPELPAANGSLVGDSSAEPDAYIKIRRKGDFASVDPNTGNLIPVPDGVVGTDDIIFFFNAFGTSDPLDLFLGDFASVDPNTGNLLPIPDCVVGTDDIIFFFNAFGS